MTQPPAGSTNPKLVFWTSRRGIALMLAIAAVVVAAIVGVRALLSGPEADRFQVTVTRCDPGTGRATAGLTVRNVTDERRTAAVQMEYRGGAGQRLGGGTVFVRDIAPGDAAYEEVSVALDLNLDDVVNCRVAEVS